MMICDSPGMGKTATAAGFLSQIKPIKPEGKTLIICKKGLIGQWKFEMNAWTDLRVLTIPFDRNEKVC